MNYRATIHTLEIEPILKPKYAEHPGKWIREAYEKNHPCVNNLWLNRHDRTPRITVNPHRLHTAPDGKYIFTYGGLQEHQQEMQTICQELEIDSYIIRRLDVCLDADVPYEQTQKTTRLIALMLGDSIGMDNRYASIDPATLEPKTLRLDNAHRDANGKIIHPTQQIEHYNRELIDQTSYTGKPIINRFELRAMGRAAGVAHTEGDIVSNWIKAFETLRERHATEVCQGLNEHLISACGRYTELAGSDKSNDFIRANTDHIYSRKQLVAFLDMLGRNNPEADTGNLLKKNRGGKVFKLYEWSHIQAEIDSMKAALRSFLEQRGNSQI